MSLIVSMVMRGAERGSHQLECGSSEGPFVVVADLVVFRVLRAPQFASLARALTHDARMAFDRPSFARTRHHTLQAQALEFLRGLGLLFQGARDSAHGVNSRRQLIARAGGFAPLVRPRGEGAAHRLRQLNVVLGCAWHVSSGQKLRQSMPTVVCVVALSAPDAYGHDPRVLGYLSACVTRDHPRFVCVHTHAYMSERHRAGGRADASAVKSHARARWRGRGRGRGCDAAQRMRRTTGVALLFSLAPPRGYLLWRCATARGTGAR